jgi:predicted dehydrogenase
VKAAIVGLGAIAEAHLRKLAWLDGVEVAGVCDLDGGLAHAVADRYGVPVAGDDLADVLRRSGAQTVHVLTPPQAHRDLVLAALGHGAHVLVEKPAATTRADVDAMRAAARDAGRMLVENYNYRFTDVVLRALALLHAGRIGELALADVSMTVSVGDPQGAYADAIVPHFGHALPGGALFNFASHPASLLVAAMGGFDDVRTWSRRVGEASLSDDELRALVTAGRMAATLTLTTRARPSSFTLQLRGTRGVIDVDVVDRRLVVHDGAPGLGRLAGSARAGAAQLAGTAALALRYARGRHDYFHGLGVLLRRFYAAAQSGGEPPIAAAEMDEVNRLLFALVAPEHRA